MISAACPATYVSRPRKSVPTLHAVAPAGDALEAVASSAATVSPIRSSARCTWPCHRRQRTCSTASAKRAPSWRSFVRDVRPAFDWLGNMLDAHRQGNHINWLRVSGTTKMPQVDERICHQLHAIVPLLDELE